MEYYLERNIPLTPEQVPHDMRDNKPGAEPVLQVKLYYSKDARRRGLKLSISRVIIERSNGFTSTRCHLFADYNGMLHVADMARKNDKTGRAWAAVIEAQLDQIAAIALESESPDWSAIFPHIRQPLAA